MNPTTILVIDDSEVSRKLTRAALASSGYEVVEAADGQSAIEAFARHRPRLVLLDLLLPDIDGVELMRRLRTMPGGRTARILTFSGWVSSASAEQRASDGFDGHLLKPLAPSELLRAIRAYVSLAEASGRPSPGSASRRSAPRRETPTSR